jgi:hypothetical protein
MAVRRAWFIPIFVFLMCANLFPHERHKQSISVDESKVEFRLFPELEVDIPLINHSDQSLQGTLLVEMLAWDSNRIVHQETKDFQIIPGTQVQSLKWSQEKIDHIMGLGAYRLRYTVTPHQSGGFEPAQGIVQLGPHIVDGFTIQAYPSGQVECALDCRFLVRVAEPNNGRGLAGYDVKDEFNPNSGTALHVVTDEDGYAEIHYDIPEDRPQHGAWFRLAASHGPFSSLLDITARSETPPHLAVIANKPIFHAGETVHLRILLTGVDRRPWAGGNVTLTITDVWKERELFRKKLITSASGEISEDWTIPDDTGDGTLSIFVSSDDQPQGNWTAKNKAKIQIEKEVKPAFVVNAVPDQPYYLPGQNAKLTVSGSDLSGNPICNGSVRVMADPMPESGNLDKSGKIVVLVDLKKKWDWVKDAGAPWWQGPHSYDFPIEVTLTDNLTGKTESRHVVLQLAKQEIHLYMDAGGVAGSEKSFGIVSSHADKSPVSVDGVVEAVIPDANEKCPSNPDTAHKVSLGAFHTNSYGVTRFTLPQSWIHYAYPQREDGPYSWYSRVHRWDAPNEQASRNACILLRASDGKGEVGTLYQPKWVVHETPFATRISTDHAIYRPGDPIRVKIESDKGLTEALVEIRTPGQEMVGDQHTQLTNGHAEMIFPFDPHFRGLLEVHVYAVTGTDDANPVDSWSQTIIFPTGEGLKAGERWPTEIWTPDQAQPDHRRFINMIDQEDNGRIAGIEKTDLLRLDPSKPFPEGMDMVAWMLLGPPQGWGGWRGGYYDFSHERFDKENLAMIEPVIKKLYKQTGKSPKTEDEFVRELNEAGIDYPALRDGWGMPYRAVFRESVIYLVSNGPDKLPNTIDDYLAERISFP